MAESWKTTLDALDHGIRYLVLCPDKVERVLWGANRWTGDLFVWGWDGNVSMDCSHQEGQLWVQFTTKEHAI